MSNRFKFLCDKRFYEISFISILLVSFLFWLIYIFIGGYESNQWHLFFLDLQDFLADTLNGIGYSGERDVYNCTYYTGLSEKAYPPLAFMFMYFLSRLVNMQPYYEMEYFLPLYAEPKLMFFIILCIAFTLIFLFEVIRHGKNGNNVIKILTALAIVLSRPVLFTVERANTLLISTIFVLIFILYYDSKNKVLKELALVSLALAFALKITPAVLGVLLLYNKQWKDAIKAAVYGVLLFFLPFLFFKGGFDNFSYLIRNITQHLSYYGGEGGCTLYGVFVYYFGGASAELLSLFSVITKVICGFILISGMFLKRKCDVALSMLIVLLILPSHSAYYCLLYLIPAILVFLNEENKRKTDLIVLIAYIMVLSIYVSPLEGVLDYHLSIVLLVFFCIINNSVSLAEKIKLMNDSKTDKKRILNDD